MERIQRKTVEEWSEVFSEWRRSGETQRGYCRSKGIAFSAFTYWKRKQGVVGHEHDRLDGRLMVKLGSMTQAHPPVGRAPITARAGGIEIDLSGRESEDILIRIFRALKAAS